MAEKKEEEKFVLLTNEAGIPVVVYEKATQNVMPPHVLLSDPEANQVPTKTEEEEKKDKSKKRMKYVKYGVLGTIAIIGIFIGYNYLKRKKSE